MTNPIISVRNLVCRLIVRKMLNGINLDVERGEILARLGGSGSGKSTLLRHIIGLAQPESGAVCVQGIDINRCTAKELMAIRRKMGVAFQGSALFSSMSVEENCELPLRELTNLSEQVIEIMTYIK